MKHHLHTPIIEINSSGEGLFHFKLEAPEIAQSCKPGHFVNIKVANGNYPLLRRPISIHDTDGDKIIEIVFRVVGSGTAVLAERRLGDTIDLYGPLGNPFDIIEDKHAILVGGGVGIPPIHNLFREFKKRNLSHTVICGLRNKNEIGLAGSIPQDADEHIICTDDGSMGHHGFVTQPLSERIKENCVIYACGPEPMLKAIIAMSKEHNVPAQISFEQQMACAFGACIGCSIETNSGYKRVCTEGPVFDASEFY